MFGYQQVRLGVSPDGRGRRRSRMRVDRSRMRVELSDTQVGVLRFFAGAQELPRSFFGSYRALLEQGLIERDERDGYQITQSGRRLVAWLDGQEDDEQLGE